MIEMEQKQLKWNLLQLRETTTLSISMYINAIYFFQFSSCKD